MTKLMDPDAWHHGHASAGEGDRQRVLVVPAGGVPPLEAALGGLTPDGSG
jgi:hypothetical protein